VRPVSGAPELASTMTPQDFRLLRDLVQEHCGIWFRDDAAYLLERRLGPRLAVHGLADFHAYWRLLRFSAAGRAELDVAVEALATNETYFGREPLQLAAFRDEILPALAREKAAERRLRIWSAGCSTGEEAYTIAILVAQSRLFEGWDVEVFGSDVSRRVLAAAREARYGPHAFRSEEGEALKPWFAEEAGRWTVVPGIRRLVTFGHVNLVDAGALATVGGADAIFCRNVMIYFDVPTRRGVVRAFHEKLRDGGYLLLGHSESLLHVSADFELVHLRGDLVHRKPRPA
jgi:chemotaxis protein methyltransferase CheR